MRCCRQSKLSGQLSKISTQRSIASRSRALTSPLAEAVFGAGESAGRRVGGHDCCTCMAASFANDMGGMQHRAWKCPSVDLVIQLRIRSRPTASPCARCGIPKIPRLASSDTLDNSFRSNRGGGFINQSMRCFSVERGCNWTQFHTLGAVLCARQTTPVSKH